MLSAVLGLLVVGRSHATLLGIPIGDTHSMEECIRSKVEKLIVMEKRFQLLNFFSRCTSTSATLFKHPKGSVHPANRTMLPH